MLLQQILIIIAMFSVCLLLSFIINKYFESKGKDQNKNKDDNTKIYYITNMQKKKPKSKTPKVAFKNIILKPKEFERFFIDDKNTKN